MERWHSIDGYEGFYEVSDIGRVRGLDRMAKDGRKIIGRILSQLSGKWGHKTVSLHRDGEKRFCVQRLVLQAFKGPCPEGMEAAHNDGDSSHNALENLRWDTPKGNHADKYKHGTVPFGERNTAAKITEADVRNIFEMRRSGMRVHKIGEQFGICKQHVSDILNRKRWPHLDIEAAPNKRRRAA